MSDPQADEEPGTSPEIPESCRESRGLNVTRFEPGRALALEVTPTLVALFGLGTPPVVAMVACIALYPVAVDFAGDLLRAGRHLLLAGAVLLGLLLLAGFLVVPAVAFFRRLRAQRLEIGPDGVLVENGSGRKVFPPAEVADVTCEHWFSEHDDFHATFEVKLSFKDPAKKAVTLVTWDDDLQPRAASQAEFLASALKSVLGKR